MVTPESLSIRALELDAFCPHGSGTNGYAQQWYECVSNKYLGLFRIGVRSKPTVTLGRPATGSLPAQLHSPAQQKHERK